jgi:hypothetical protein
MFSNLCVTCESGTRKVVPVRDMKAYGELEVLRNSFLTSAVNWVGGQPHVRATLPLGAHLTF